MSLEMTCHTCGADFTLTSADVIAGPDTYWYCPACRRLQTGGYVEGDQGPAAEPNTVDTGDLAYPPPKDPEDQA